MASLPKFMLIFAALLVPAPLAAQVGRRGTEEPVFRPAHREPAFVVQPVSAAQPVSAMQTVQPAQWAQPAPAPAEFQEDQVVVPAAEQVDDLYNCRRPLANFVRINDVPPCGPPRESIFVFGGLLTKGSMGDTLDVFNVTYDGNYVIALGYQRYHWTTRRFHWGWEVGMAGRYGHEHSMEFWGGPTVRHEGITLFNFLRISPALTAGFSTVTDTMGQEVHRERARDGDGTFLYYLGPDFAASLTSHPNIEFFYRLHHRCGGGQTLGNLSEGYNANVVGLRLRF